MAARIVIFEDNNNLRESLALLLNNHDGYEVVGHYPDCLNATEIVRVDNPDVVLMDIDMPGKSGIEGVAMVKEAKPKTAVIIYTVFEDDEKLFKCLCAGANGYLLKKTPPQKLFDAIHEVLAGGAPLSPQIARKVLNTFHVNTTKFKYALTPREMEVLQYLTKGYGSKQIAAEMFLAYETIRSHLKNIYQKLHVNCGKEAIVKALQEQIV
ncbi:MAG TPA: response regulator transcription factor [Saprospiraceae bacterium]|nr:response regulator transcription factor [Saprospiraceae bacterium]